MKSIEVAMMMFLGIITIGSVWIFLMLRKEEREDDERFRKHLKK